VLDPSLPAAHVPLVTLAAGVAVVDACRAVDVDATLKWPNDVLVGDDAASGAADESSDGNERGGRKLAGILTEMEGEADRVSWLLVGVGLNANIDADALPAGATSLQEQVGEIDRRAVLQTVLESVSTLLGDPETIIERWQEYNSTLGRRVRVDTGRKEIEGRAVDVQFPGALVIDTDTGEKIVHAGDCEHLRPA
jgi:Biotin-(acetyl-CoA carboxylase) ligase